MSRQFDDDVGIGIDLGTTWSCVGFLDGRQKVHIVGDRTFPSIVSFIGNKRLLCNEVKEWEQRHGTQNSSNTLYDSKRMIGKTFVELDTNLKRNWPFTLVSSRDGLPQYSLEVCGELRTFSPEQVSAMILTKLKKLAEIEVAVRCPGKNISGAVITVPAYFTDLQRQSTRDAAEIAGIKVIEIINEPTAAALAYGFGKCKGNRKSILVFDLGGGTLDVTILNVQGGVFDVKSTCGDSCLGGQDFDAMLLDYFILKLDLPGPSIREDPVMLAQLRKNCEAAKHKLSTSSSAEIRVADYPPVQVTRNDFEKMMTGVKDRILKCVEQALNDAKLAPRSIDEVVLVGGSSRIPLIQSALSNHFKSFFGSPKTLCKDVDPDKAVGFGAALHAYSLTQVYEDLGITLLDVTPLSIGIGLSKGNMHVMIERNSSLPCKESLSFTTVEDNQTQFVVKIFQGENIEVAANNTLLGEFTLAGIPPMLKGQAKLKIKLEMNLNGILSVTAQEVTSVPPIAMSMTITGAARLRKEEISTFVEIEKALQSLDSVHRAS